MSQGCMAPCINVTFCGPLPLCMENYWRWNHAPAQTTEGAASPPGAVLKWQRGEACCWSRLCNREWNGNKSLHACICLWQIQWMRPLCPHVPPVPPGLYGGEAQCLV